MRILVDIGSAVGARHGLDEAFEQVANMVGEVVPFDHLAIAMIDSGAVTVIGGRCKGDRYPLAGTPADTVARSRQGTMIDTSNYASMAG